MTELDLIQSVETQLGTVTELKFICENYGQLDYYSPNHTVKWPLALIDLKAINFDDIGMDRTATPQNRQMGYTAVSLRIADLKLTNSSSKAPLTQKNQARSIWLLIGKVHEKLQGWIPLENCSKLMRRSCARVEREDGIQEYEVIYITTMNNV